MSRPSTNGDGTGAERPLGATLLSEEEKEGLLIPTVILRRDLDRFEQANIQEARLFYANHNRSVNWLLTREGVRAVHRRMFDQVWGWAGTFRRTGKNIGVEPERIQVDLETLLEDARFWLANETYPPEELCVRFKHRLVFIHCFPNGNGRHARYMADLLLSKAFDLPMFSWGGDILGRNPDLRRTYIMALRAADAGDIGPLLAFARSA